MLNADDVVPVPGSEVLAWADHASPDTVWALPARPRLTTGPDGQAEIDLLLYRRRGEAAPMGGQLTMTVDVALTDDERAAAAAAVDARRPRPAEGAPPLPPIEVRAPLWTSATVHAQLAANVALQGTPSLLADNRCLLTTQLDATGAARADAAWADGFADVSIELRGAIDGVTTGAVDATVTAHASGQAGSADAATCAPNGTAAGATTATAALTARAAATVSRSVSLHLRGPLRLPAAVRATRRTVVDL